MSFGLSTWIALCLTLQLAGDLCNCSCVWCLVLHQHSWMDVPLWLLRACFLYFGWSRTGVWGRCIKCLRLLRPGANETFYVGRKRNNEQCCPKVLMVLMCCVGVTSSADLWDDIQRITVPSSIATLLSSKGVLRWCFIVAGNAFYFFIKVKNKPKKPWYKMSLEELGRAVCASICGSSTFAGAVCSEK